MSPEEPRTHHLLPASEWTFCPTCSLTQVRGLLLHTGVSLGRHVTAQRQSHWLNRPFKTTDIWLQFPGYSAAFSKSMPICKYGDVYLAPTCVCRLSRNWQVSRWAREALSTRAYRMFQLVKNRNMCNCPHNLHAYNSTHLLNRRVRDANIARSARRETCVKRMLPWEQAWHLLKVLHVPLLLRLFKSTHYASPTASFNTIITPSRGSQRQGPSVTANRAASLAALSPCLRAISRCVSAPLNSSRGKSIKAGVREENPIKPCAWFPQHERSPRGFIQVRAP